MNKYDRIIIAYCLIALWTSCYFQQAHSKDDELSAVILTPIVGIGWPFYWTGRLFLASTEWAIPKTNSAQP